ncbi:hypothetical protein BDR26DRAFT_333567 [Obelidium mucronatum]|nr:hypothetical protein BDR26DRAFT_333567 [Obelidium mucronatum]
MMNLIEIELGKHEFYGENEEKYLMDTSHSFWDVVGSSIGASPVGSAAYIIYYVAVSLAALIPYAINMKNYQKYKLKEDEEDQKAKVDDQDFGEETAIKPQDKGAPAQTNSTVPKAKRTIQNYVGVFTIFITMFQFVYLSLHRSIAIDSSSLLVSVISYVGLIIDSPIYYAILIIMAVVWVACLQYSIIVHPFLSRHHPFTAARLTSFHTFIALYLPNYVAIFYNPSVELFAKAFDCRLSHITNRFFNSFDPGHLHCFKGYHWAMVVLSFIYTTSFVFSVVRYSKILKAR